MAAHMPSSLAQGEGAATFSPHGGLGKMRQHHSTDDSSTEHLQVFTMLSSCNTSVHWCTGTGDVRPTSQLCTSLKLSG